ncbi:hypothetical protein ACFCYX_35415 [Streptomyces populi]|uniref:hypothetical protein n=1 Tax=Streptomyces populi TaxID=2058924 RepID=UPI001F0C24E2|nr:hypothetical protein [Streptomyces populi]
MDRLDVALDVVVEQLDELRSVGSAGGVQEDLLQFADDQFLAERWEHALGGDLLSRAAGYGGLGVVRAELRCFTRRLLLLMRNLTEFRRRSGWRDRAGQLEVNRYRHGAGEGVEVGASMSCSRVSSMGRLLGGVGVR